MKLTKDCLQTVQMMFFAASFDLAWLLAPFGPFLSALRWRFCWALAPCTKLALGEA